MSDASDHDDLERAPEDGPRSPGLFSQQACGSKKRMLLSATAAVACIYIVAQTVIFVTEDPSAQGVQTNNRLAADVALNWSELVKQTDKQTVKIRPADSQADGKKVEISNLVEEVNSFRSLTASIQEEHKKEHNGATETLENEFAGTFDLHGEVKKLMNLVQEVGNEELVSATATVLHKAVSMIDLLHRNEAKLEAQLKEHTSDKTLFVGVISGKAMYNSRLPGLYKTWLRTLDDDAFTIYGGNPDPAWPGVTVLDLGQDETVATDMINKYFPQGVNAARAAWNDPQMAPAWLISQRKWILAVEDMYKNHPGYEWYGIVDDDCFLRTEKLRTALSMFKSSDHHLFGWQVPGHPIKVINGGGGYFFTKASLAEIGDKAAGCNDYYEKSPNLVSEGAMTLCFRNEGKTEPATLAGLLPWTYDDTLATRRGQPGVPANPDDIISVHNAKSEEQMMANWDRWYPNADPPPENPGHDSLDDAGTTTPETPAPADGEGGSGFDYGPNVTQDDYVPFLHDADSDKLQKELYDRQHPNCADPQQGWTEQSHWSGKCGIGCDGHVIFHYFQTSMMRHQPFFTTGMHPYSADPHCAATGSNGLECYTIPMTDCKRGELQGRPGVNHYNSGDVGMPGFGNMVSQIPAEYRHRGLMWWRSQLVYYLFRPNPEMKTILQQAERDLPLVGPCVSIHVRHGDRHDDKYVNKDGFKEHALSSYIKLLPADFEFKTILLLTEDNAVIEAAKKINADGKEKYRIVWTENVRENLGVPEAIAAHGAYTEGVIGYKNLWLAAKCQKYIGTLSSQYARLTAELIFARGDMTNNVISLDWSLQKVLNEYLPANPY